MGAAAGYFGRWPPAPDESHRSFSSSCPRWPSCSSPRRSWGRAPITGDHPSILLPRSPLAVPWPASCVASFLSPEREGVVEAARGVRRLELADHLPTHAAEHDGAHRRECHARRRAGHPDRVDPVVPRLRCEATDGLLGEHAAAVRRSRGHRNTYLIYFPGLFILVTVMAVNFLGDGLRDPFDPQSTH